MEYQAKSVIMGRMPRAQGKEFKTFFAKVYSTNKPLEHNGFPDKEIVIENIEHATFDEAPAYYLEGNDLVFDNITSVTIQQDGTSIHVSVSR